MTRNNPKAPGRLVAEGIARAAVDADRAFVRCAASVQNGLLRGAAGLSLAAFSLIPTLSDVAKELALRLGRDSEHWAQRDRSIVLASVPGAAYRTAAVMELLSAGSTRVAQRTVEAVFNSRPPADLVIDGQYREIGRSVASLVDQGLDPGPLGQAIRERVEKIRNLKLPRDGS